MLHDWSDAEVVDIVSNVAAAMRPGDRYLSVEAFLHVHSQPQYPPCLRSSRFFLLLLQCIVL